MRAQCCICADLFESSHSVNISATPCGHVFHEACLMRWMDTSSTCPSCRTHIKKTQVIKRLFFDINEDVDGDEDVSHYKNQLSDLKAQLREATKEVRELEDSRDSCQALLDVTHVKYAEMSTKLSREVSMREVLKADLKRVQKENDWHIQEIKELQKKAEKLNELQRVETILKGSSTDAEEMLRQYSDGGDSSIRQLSSLVTVMKREYNQVLADKRTAKEQLSKLRQQIGHFQMEAKRAKKEAAYLRLELQTTNKNLSEKEKENDENRRKIVHLRKALRHNKTEGSQSFIAALNEDSPNVAYSPMVQPKVDATPTSSKLAVAEVDQENKSSPLSPQSFKRPCVSPDLFMDTPVKKAKTKVEAVAEKPNSLGPVGQDFQSGPETNLTADSEHTNSVMAKLAERDEDDGPHIPPSMMSIMHSKLVGKSAAGSKQYTGKHSGSIITRGYDGFGGSTTFVHPQGPPRGSFMKLAQQKKKLLPSCAKKNANILKLSVPKCQRQIKDCILNAAPSATATSNSLVSSSLSSSSSSSDSLSLPSSSSSSSSLSLFGHSKKPVSSNMGSLKKSALSSSTSSKGSSSSKSLSSSKLGMFISKGPSLSSSKRAAARNDDFIDLT
ncbi:hypothetical protein EGW08_010179 [Elysia chlorotica]|uniref:RING-type domain-containing protein n=1 Tax=Elysia chlorotica TaxID=188477 RepID=A0A3S0ZNM2_ELYCH|nr:hypothetical protein EGW08_010179 [Elysia chlorotica]